VASSAVAINCRESPSLRSVCVACDGLLYTAAGLEPIETPRALEASEIPGIVADFQSAVARSMSTGFDGAEIHAAYGYLIDQFLQSQSNSNQLEYHRSGSYCSSVQNRSRLLKEMVKAVTYVVPTDRLVFVFLPMTCKCRQTSFALLAS
jgi:N-ethylmaleimide reductase